MQSRGRCSNEIAAMRGRSMLLPGLEQTSSPPSTIMPPTMTDTTCARALDASVKGERHICRDVVMMEPEGTVQQRRFGRESISALVE